MSIYIFIFRSVLVFALFIYLYLGVPVSGQKMICSGKQLNMGDGWMEKKIGEVKANKYINLESEAGLLIGI